MLYVSYNNNEASIPMSFGKKTEYFLFGNFDIEMVIRAPTTQGRDVPLLCFGGPAEVNIGNNLYAFGFTSARKMYINHEYSGGIDVTKTEAGTSLVLGKWQRVRVVRSGLSYKGYVDGVLVLDQTFTTVQKPTVFDIATGNQFLQLGGDYYVSDTRRFAYDLMIAYTNIKDETGVSVFTFGVDPGGVGAPNAPTLKGNVSIDPYVEKTQSNRAIGVTKGTAKMLNAFSRNIERSVQFKKGQIDNDAYFGVFERPAQRSLGLVLDMTGAGGSGDGPGEISTPRNFPLEVQWKKANKATFEK